MSGLNSKVEIKSTIFLNKFFLINSSYAFFYDGLLDSPIHLSCVSDGFTSVPNCFLIELSFGEMKVLQNGASGFDL